ncbi:hypothetical protein ACFL5V_13640, partial [Fibrobacterota bacterium]
MFSELLVFTESSEICIIIRQNLTIPKPETGESIMTLNRNGKKEEQFVEEIGLYYDQMGMPKM